MSFCDSIESNGAISALLSSQAAARIWRIQGPSSVGGTDLYGKEVYLATWSSDWSDMESELIMAYDSGCDGATCLYLTGLFELKSSASGQVLGCLKYHHDNDYYVVTVTP